MCSRAQRPGAMRHSPRTPVHRSSRDTLLRWRWLRLQRSMYVSSPCSRESAQHAHIRARAFQMTRSMRAAKCYFSVFSVARTHAHTHKHARTMNGSNEFPPRYFQSNQTSYPQLLLPKGFHSHHPALWRTSAFYPVTSERGGKWIQAAVPCSQAKDGMISPLSYPPLLCDLPPPPCLSAALWRNSRGVQKCPSPVCCPHSPQDGVQAKTAELRCQT